MKARLLRDASIRHKEGEIVESSPEQYAFLAPLGVVEEVKKTKKSEVK